MHALIQFIQRHHLLFLFVILQGAAGMLLIRNNYIQRIAIVSATDVVSGSVYEQMSKWRDYLLLREQNIQLQNENIQLRSMMQNSFYRTDYERTLYVDTVNRRRFEYISAKVINNEINRQFNFITLDRGKNSGITEGMAIIGPEGIVGIIYGVSERFATVMPVINRNFRVSVKFKKNDHFGSLSWDGRSYRRASLNEISLHVPVEIGDTIVVSGYSASFPEGITVGTVERVEPKDGSFYSIDVLLATDFRRLNYVTVVEDLMRNEQLELEQKLLEIR